LKILKKELGGKGCDVVKMSNGIEVSVPVPAGYYYLPDIKRTAYISVPTRQQDISSILNEPERLIADIERKVRSAEAHSNAGHPNQTSISADEAKKLIYAAISRYGVVFFYANLSDKAQRLGELGRKYVYLEL